MAVVETYTVKTRGIGLPDYAQAKPVSGVPIGPIYTSTDIGELAARLGSIVTFDRRGNVLFLESFEDTLNKWAFAGAGAGYSVVQSDEHTRAGAFSAKLTTGPVTDDWVAMYHMLPFPVQSKFGFEFSFSRDAKLQWANLFVVQYDGEYAQSAEIYWTAGTGICSYLGDDGLYHNLLPPINLYEDYNLFHTIKMATDFVDHEYVRLIVNNVVYDMSNLAVRVNADLVTSPHIYLYLAFATNIDAAAVVYVDDVIVTQQEPPNLVE